MLSNKIKIIYSIIHKIKHNHKNKFLLNNIQNNKNLHKYFDNNSIKNRKNILN